MAAGRANLLPGTVILVVALAVLLGYHHSPRVGAGLEVIREWKQRFGFAFAAVSTALCGGLLPLLFRTLGRRGRPDPEWRHFTFHLGFWAYKGVEIDLLYRLQARWIGDSSSAPVVAAKTIVDQFIYVPLWAVPTMVIAYLWKECGYSAGRLRRLLGRNWYLSRCLPVLVSNWIVWVPAVIVIYKLPLALQLPLQNLVLCLFVLMVIVLTRADRGE